jgi:hypothetical protein
MLITEAIMRFALLTLFPETNTSEAFVAIIRYHFPIWFHSLYLAKLGLGQSITNLEIYYASLLAPYHL